MMVRVMLPPDWVPEPQEVSARTAAAATSAGRLGSRKSASCSGRADIPTIARGVAGVKKRSDERFAVS
ncbi:hypothetical protein GCM10010176_058930 [Nonomuraea spiralis]|nr:hypothetical protein GCM10010176_058930 [Nonomuraea spiralis]